MINIVFVICFRAIPLEKFKMLITKLRVEIELLNYSHIAHWLMSQWTTPKSGFNGFLDKHFELNSANNVVIIKFNGYCRDTD